MTCACFNFSYKTDEFPLSAGAWKDLGLSLVCSRVSLGFMGVFRVDMSQRPASHSGEFQSKKDFTTQPFYGKCLKSMMDA